MGRIIAIISASVIAAAVILSLTVFKEKIKSAFYIGHMESDNRIRQMNIDRIMDRLNIRRGDRVADIGAGSGLFSRKLSSLVSSGGKVYSVDINKELLMHIDEVNEKENIKNIQTVLAGEDDPGIPGPVDLVFICDTFHYMDNQERYIGKLVDYLDKNGRIAIVSFIRTWPPMSNKFTDKDLTAWMEKAGMQLAGYHDDIIQDQYLAIYRKK
ncbi:MAG: class I SAM-dependent methyltransferase [Spirochaetes bacterium]|nr:class I SAM-dependent methyltransferase [Spirochaetota bacterium]